ncbi:MAG TPA: DUF3995 domain-containing protein [Eudoraea sp.]|nr:DUF3995 domain-containing protein [Eudoraea sp.]
MLAALAIVEGLGLAFLASLHFYWLFGGKWGFSEALPTRDNGIRVLNPTKAGTAFTGLALFFFSGYYLNLVLEGIQGPEWLLNYTGWGIALIFLARVIGDFKYVGFFKKVNHTPFALKDTRFFTPLCILLSVIAVFVQLAR